MAETMSIQDRIASLNLGHIGRGPPPPKPAVKPTLHHSVSSQDLSCQSSYDERTVGNQPNRGSKNPSPPQRLEKSRLPLPPPRPSIYRAPSSQNNNAPLLPPRKGSQSQALTRRESQESISSTLSAHSSISGKSARTSVTSASRSPSVEVKNGSTFRVPTYDPASLPALPPKKSEQPSRPLVRTSTSGSLSKTISDSSHTPTPPLPSRRGSAQPAPPPHRDSTQSTKGIPQARALPPPLPGRNQLIEHNRTSPVPPVPQPARRQVSQIHSNGHSQVEQAVPSRLPPKSALAFGMNKPTEETSSIPSRPESTPIAEANLPPPVPTASRPNLAALQASKPRPHGAPVGSYVSQAPKGVCMNCRDFSGPDQHAARFPRQEIPTQDINWLATQLTDPFPSLTDKARALFTWMHHNIAYNTEAFFSGNLQCATPASTIATGLAVCEGYAGLFTAFASQAGMESVVISGHGMGFGGMKGFAPGQPLPLVEAGHAWNVVKIDSGEWKLIDPCWGAGHIGEDRQYHQQFHPAQFTMSNEQFGLKHFPLDEGLFYRADGRVPTWQEYWLGQESPAGGDPKLTVYSGCIEEHGINEEGFKPRNKHIKVQGQSPKQQVQFQMETVCEHWDNERMGSGKPFVYLLQIGGKDGRERRQVPFQTNGRYWWVDVILGDLGCAGQTVQVNALKTVAGQDARGFTVRDYEGAVGRKGMSWTGVAAWQLT